MPLSTSALIRATSLENGLSVITEHIPGLQSVSVRWLVPAGYTTEPENRLGLSVVVEELMFRGAGDLDSKAQADACDAIGMTRVIQSGSTHMTLGTTVMQQHVAGALSLLNDMVQMPKFESGSIEPARALALMGLESLQDDPTQRASLAARAHHMGSPFDRTGLGTEPCIKAITRDDVASHWNHRAVSDGSVLALAGNIEHDDAVAAIAPLVQSWMGSASVPTVSGMGPRGYHHEEDDSQQVQIVVLFDAPSESHTDCILERFMVQVLSGGMSGRLFTEVREKRGLCYSVNAGYATSRDFGRTSCYVGTMPDRAQESLDVLWAELHRLKSPGGAITEDEFAIAKTGLKASTIFEGESTAARASALAVDQFRLGKPRALDELAAQIDAVTLDQLNEYVQRRSLAHATIQTLGPAALKAPEGV
ncbi:MAG: insulinase family protein [Phycisphaeraceae bacterium]|nr:insulinase family protein [Phycisphaerales bacterium]MCB9859129.1 insulinase family protein [Phycisphaeraceae bacterium]